MSTNPTVDKQQTTTFAEAMNIEPTVTVAGRANQFKVRLSRDGVELGWLGQDSKQWARLVKENAALTLELYLHNRVTYYRIKGTKRYMSVSNSAYVGFYNWSGATGFKRDGSYLRSEYNDQRLSYDNEENGYLTAWDGYLPLDFEVR